MTIIFCTSYCNAAEIVFYFRSDCAELVNSLYFVTNFGESESQLKVRCRGDFQTSGT